MVSALDSGSSGLSSNPSRGTALCSWARHFTLIVPLSTQVYKWVPVNLLLGADPAMNQHPIQGGVEILLIASCYITRDELPGGVFSVYMTGGPTYLFGSKIYTPTYFFGSEICHVLF